jgi:hypothetical protein
MVPPMASYASRRLGTLLVAVAGARAPLDAEWSSYLSLCQEVDREVGVDTRRATAVVFTDGGAPTSPQRMALFHLMKGREIATAVVSDSLVLHAVIGMVSFINPGIRVFAAQGWAQAQAFIRLEAGQVARILKVAHEVGEVKVLRALDPAAAC